MSADTLQIPEISSAATTLDSDIATMVTTWSLDAGHARLESTFTENEASVLFGAHSYRTTATVSICRHTPDLTTIETLFPWTVQCVDAHSAEPQPSRSSSSAPKELPGSPSTSQACSKAHCRVGVTQKPRGKSRTSGCLDGNSSGVVAGLLKNPPPLSRQVVIGPSPRK